VNYFLAFTNLLAYKKASTYEAFLFA
jgi:hypothetical protein